MADCRSESPERRVRAGGEGAPLADEEQAEAERILRILLAECPLKQAASLAAQITGLKKNALYERALQLKNED